MQNAAEEKPTVIFIHGLWMTGLEMFLLRKRVARDGYNTFRFRYFSLARGMETNLTRLHRFIQQHPTTTLHLVGHSLGGLLILRLFERYNDIPNGRVVLLGSPVRGSQVARAIQRLPIFRHLLLGKAGGEALAVKQEAHWQGEREIGIVAGTRGIGIGRLFTRLPEPHDGTVAVAETHLDGATDTLHLPATHTSLVYSSRVADAVGRFLSGGHF